MKVIFLMASIFLFTQGIFSQPVVNDDPLTIKELKLTRDQQREIRKIDKQAASEILSLEKNSDGSEDVPIKINKVKGARIKKIRNVLTPEQRITWRQKMMENRPRRGVTGLPNERTVR